jgi:alpha-galactosidase
MRPPIAFAAATFASIGLISMFGATKSPFLGPDDVVVQAPVFGLWAPTPPMGWNSWDCFATTVTEAQTKAQADVMAEKLAHHGWNIVTVDIQWYEPEAKSFNYRKDAKLVMDEWGRLLPAPNRFPSAANGAGFKPLADYVHAKGLKLGIHLLRGIPRQAVAQNTPVQGMAYHAADIANPNSVCKWNTDMFGVDMTKPGAQDYYDSVFALIASWQVDFVKVDDISRPYEQNIREIEAIRHAIDRTGRRMVLSLSPGETPLDQAAHVAANANLWRISDDFWDKWPALLEQFERLRKWAPFAGHGHWPDADMLPLGTLDLGRRQTRFTPAEQRTMLTLWSIARSPLILGADLTKLDDATLALLTNDEVIAVDQHSRNGRQLFAREGFVAWIADVPDSPDKYVAVFNTNDQPKASGADFEAGGGSISLSLAELGLDGTCQVRDLWRRENVGFYTDGLTPGIVCHGAALFRFSPVKK